MKIVKLLICLFVVSMIGGFTEVSLRPLVGMEWAKASYLITVIGTIYATKKIMF